MTQSADQSLFSRVEGAQALITNRGYYTQADVYRLGELLFAQVKTGFVRLLAKEMTTVKSIKWKTIVGTNFVEEYNGPRLTSKSSKLKVAK